MALASFATHFAPTHMVGSWDAQLCACASCSPHAVATVHARARWQLAWAVRAPHVCHHPFQWLPTRGHPPPPRRECVLWLAVLRVGSIRFFETDLRTHNRFSLAPTGAPGTFRGETNWIGERSSSHLPPPPARREQCLASTPARALLAELVVLLPRQLSRYAAVSGGRRL